MQSESYQVVTPQTTRAPHTGESMTFRSELSRDSFIIRERAKGWEVFLSYQGTSSNGTELYEITRRAL